MLKGDSCSLLARNRKKMYKVKGAIYPSYTSEFGENLRKEAESSPNGKLTYSDLDKHYGFRVGEYLSSRHYDKEEMKQLYRRRKWFYGFNHKIRVRDRDKYPSASTISESGAVGGCDILMDCQSKLTACDPFDWFKGLIRSNGKYDPKDWMYCGVVTYFYSKDAESNKDDMFDYLKKGTCRIDGFELCTGMCDPIDQPKASYGAFYSIPYSATLK